MPDPYEGLGTPVGTDPYAGLGRPAVSPAEPIPNYDPRVEPGAYPTDSVIDKISSAFDYPLVRKPAEWLGTALDTPFRAVRGAIGKPGGKDWGLTGAGKAVMNPNSPDTPSVVDTKHRIGIGDFADPNVSVFNPDETWNWKQLGLKALDTGVEFGVSAIDPTFWSHPGLSRSAQATRKARTAAVADQLVGNLPARMEVPTFGKGTGNVLATVAGASAIIWLAPFPPMADFPQHAGQVALLRDLLLGRSPWSGEMRRLRCVA